MSLFTVDQDKCKRDGICEAECPIRLIEFKEKEAFPTAVSGADERCVACGHCVTVCPHGALSLKTVKPSDCLTIDQKLIPNPEQLEHFLKSRRSIRSFKDKPVERTLIEKLIDIARFAPSGHNTQPVHWLVFDDKDKTHRLSALVVDWMRYMIANMPQIAGPLHMEDLVEKWDQGIDRVCRSAPCIIVAHAPAAAPTSQGSCTIALSHLELAAYAQKLGACWAGYLGIAASTFPPLVQELALSEGHQAFGAMMIGYPKFAYHRIPPRVEPRITWR
ncbi:MAG: nitroreductase family protein [Candidatus Saccharibacteria bacterium]